MKNQARIGFHGILVSDLAIGFSELLTEASQEKVDFEYLDRKEKESDPDYLKRIHKWMRRSVERGFPPVLSLRSFAVKTDEKNENKPAWRAMNHHFVAIRSVSTELKENAAGFEVGVIDSSSGKVSQVFIHLEPNNQPFRAMKGNEIEGEWLDGRPFLLVTAPHITVLTPKNLAWSDRHIVIANSLIGRF